MSDPTILFDLDKELMEGTKSAEVFELQRILEIIEDGMFGKLTTRALLSKFKTNSISLKQLQQQGYIIKTGIHSSRIWWPI